jgi:hypothetical protein
MSYTEVDVASVPAIRVIEKKLKELSSDIQIDRAAYDPGNAYALVLKAGERESRVVLSKELVDDVRDNPSSPTTSYTRVLDDRLVSPLREAVEKSGLVSYNEGSLKFLLLSHLHEESSNSRPAHKYNVIGRSGRGMFEQWLGITLRPDEKETLIWAWNELIRRRLITPTGEDLVNPDDWVRVTDKGEAVVKGKEYAEYTGEEEFINRGEVYTAYIKIKALMKQARKELLVVDSHVGEELVDMLSTLDEAIDIRLLITHVHGDFKTSFQKLQKQRGRMEARKSDHFHDRFIIVDKLGCVQLGSSIKDAGAKATVIDRKDGAVAERIIKEAEAAWQMAPELFPKVIATSSSGVAKKP